MKKQASLAKFGSKQGDLYFDMKKQASLWWLIRHFVATAVHKAWVAWYLFKTCLALAKRAVLHDLSKYGPSERDLLALSLPLLKSLKYGSEEYKKSVEDLGPALEHHYKHNAHHPEHYQASIYGMSPLDLVEMSCDWRAAVRRHRSGDMAESLRHNAKRFGYVHDKNMQSGFKRMADELGMIRRMEAYDEELEGCKKLKSFKKCQGSKKC